MFKKLRNRLIIINLTITAVILITVFSCIYLAFSRSAQNRPPIQNNTYLIFSDAVEDYIQVSLKEEKDAAARELLTILIVSGLIIEFTVAVVSYYLAEEAIKPVKSAYESQKIFIANASHEMKTPIAAISANLEAADIKGNKWIKNVEAETMKLSALNSELLTLARTGLMTETKVDTVELASLVEKSLAGFEPRLKNIKLKKKIDLPGKVKINSDDFMQLFGILMDNAIKYCNKKITVTLEREKLAISNDGRTIEKEALPHVFDRFYQADKTSDGVGLGLAIAKSLAERNKWKIDVESNKNQTTFILNF